MPSSYTPNSTASHDPSPAPSLADGVSPILRLPIDGEALNSSAFAQPYEVLGDWVAFLKQQQAPYRGVRLWVSTTTYRVGEFVVDPDDHRMYRAVSESTDYLPHLNPAVWSQCDYANSEIQAIAAALTQTYTAVVCSRGASVAMASLLGFAQGALKVILLTVQNIPWDSSVTVDLSASTTKFHATYYGGVCSLQTAGYTYGGEVGLNHSNSDGPNLVTVWARKNMGDPGTGCTVGVILWGY